MNRLCHGTVVLVACVTALSCGGDPTGDLRGDPERLSAEPSSIFIDQGVTQAVTVRALDEQGNELLAPVTAIAVNPAGLVDVTIDSTYLVGTDTTAPGVIASTRTRLSVTGVNRAAGTVTVTAAGLTLDIPVRVLPVATEFDATFSNQLPALTEQVTITAPAGFIFTDSSVVSFAGAAATIPIGHTENTVTFLPGPNTVGKATITNVVPAYAPALALDFTTVDTIATPVIDTLDAVLSTTAPTAGQPILMTAPAGFIFQPAAAVSVAGIAAIVNDRAVDGTSITFQIAPGTVGAVGVDSALLTALPQFPLSLPVRDTIVAAPLAPLAGTGSTATAPNTNAPGPGLSVAIFDVGAFTAPDITGDGGLGAQYYKVTITEEADYTFTTDWPGAADDVDAVLCFDAACSDGVFAGTGIDHPEVGTLTLTPGTYYLGVVLFEGLPQASITVTITRELPVVP
jgi:hypothetical protein